MRLSCVGPRRFASRTLPPCWASVCWSSRTGPRSPTAEWPYGAGYAAAIQAGAAEIVDPRGAVSGSLASLFRDYPHIGPVLPALGYGQAQLASLAETIDRVRADVVVSATPCDLAALIDISMPVVRACYEFAEVDEPGLGAQIDAFLDARGLADPP